jgi:serine protease AprX
MARPITARPRQGALIRFVSLFLLLGVVLAVPPAQAAPATHIVVLEPGTSLTEGGALVRAAGGRVAGRLPIIRGLAVRLPAGARATLTGDPRVRTVSVNAGVRPRSTDVLDEATTSETPLQDPAAATENPVAEAPASPGPAATGASPLATAYPYSVLAPQAWASATGAGVGVAVIDTGIDGALPDFAGADGASRVVASVVTDPSATTAADTYGHGTHVAGIIAGNGRNRAPDDPLAGKYVGIAPDADLISIKAGGDDGHATILDAIYGLQFVVEHKDDFNIRVVNLSLESTVAQSYRTDPLDAAVESAYFSGILVVAAAGNQGATEDAANYAPGNDPFALSVGAVDDQGTDGRGDDGFAEWSSVGHTQDGFAKPEIGAPGAHIVSTLAPDSAFASLCPSCIVDGEYIRAGGTSMAAPVVSGLAALVLERHPDWTPDQLKSTIIATGRNVDGGVDEVNARDAVGTETPFAGVNAGIEPNELVDGGTGEIDYTRSSWSRSSWSTAPDSLVAGWTRSSWSCTCSTSDGDAVDPTRSSWSRSSWSRSSWSTRWAF